MGYLTKTANRNKKSKFQKLWSRVEELKIQIDQRDNKLDTIAKRVETEVYPAEKEVALATVDLLHKLLKLGQRKSWANWQRHEIERWIADSLRLLASFSLIDEKIEKAIAMYDAFRLGVELDENDGKPLNEQLQEAIRQREQDQQDEDWYERQQMHDELSNEKEQIIENIVFQTLGARPSEQSMPGVDKDSLLKLQKDYDQASAVIRESVAEEIDESLEDILCDDELEDEFDDFWEQLDLDVENIDDFSTNAESADSSNKTLDLESDTLRRMFRSTAAVLHPDREKDPQKQLEKQKLMTQLLHARKNKDIMAILSLYQEYVGDGTALTHEDEKQLISSLEYQVEQLKEELEHYDPPTMMHEAAWGLFNSSKKSTDLVIAKHLESQQKQAESLRRVTPKIKSMPTLKPYLEERYDLNAFRDFDDWG